jgi:hypothetical protein
MHSKTNMIGDFEDGSENQPKKKEKRKNNNLLQSP